MTERERIYIYNRGWNRALEILTEAAQQQSIGRSAYETQVTIQRMALAMKRPLAAREKNPQEPREEKR